MSSGDCKEGRSGARNPCSMPIKHNIDLPSFDVPAGLMIGPRSFRTDRIKPAAEVIKLSSTKTGGGTLQLEMGEFDFHPPALSLLRRARSQFLESQQSELPTNMVAFDCRFHSPSNWAHFLNDHMALFSIALESFRLKIEEVYLILPSDIPKYITNLCLACGLRFVCTDGIIHSKGIRIEINHFNDIRGIRTNWLQDAKNSPVAKLVADLNTSSEHCNRRIYLSRRNTRNIRNGDELASELSILGFERIFMEDLPVKDQLKLVYKVDFIIAIHGAALAPLAYKTNATHNTKVVEIFPIGHVTNNFRCIAAKIGAQWIGILGKTEKINYPHLYNLSTPYTKHSLASFEVDVESVKIALECLSTKQTKEQFNEA